MIAAPVPTTLVGLPYRKLLCTFVAVLAGLVALWLTQTILQADEVQATMKACEAAPWTRAGRHEFLQTYRDFEPLLGGSFACLSVGTRDPWELGSRVRGQARSTEGLAEQ
jgi:hypothetical protein